MICCEGTSSENKYFEIVIRQFRLGNFPKIEIIKGQKQHEEIIDRCAESRKKYSLQLDIAENHFETWAVCDRDSYTGSFAKLKNYADKKTVKIAFSDPQFETFLLQHIEYNKTKLSGYKLETLLKEKIISNAMGKNYSKGDFDWFEKLLDERPNALYNAIKNAKKLDSSTKTPFLTVWMLVERLLEFSK